jgi:hypothetical protein
MDKLPINYHPWSDRLAMDIALLLEGSGETMVEVLRRHTITPQQLTIFNKDSVFLRKVENLRAEVRENGMTFRMKAKAQAEELLTTSWTLIHSPDVSATVKEKLIAHTVKWGGLEPKTDSVIEGVGGGVSITINLTDQPPANPALAPTVIEHE